MTLIVGSVLLLCVSLTGCSSSADSLMKEQIKDMNALADAIEKKDEAKATEISKRMEETGKKMKSLNLSESDQKALAERHKEGLMSAWQRLTAAMLGGAMDKFKGMGFPGVPK